MPDDLRIDERIVIPGWRMVEETMRAGGPGGQHQNTTESAVRLRFDLSGCQVLHAGVKQRMRRAFAGQMTDAGELLVESRSERSQHRNRAEAREKLVEMITAHLKPPKRRRRTRPTLGSKRRRLKKKKHRGRIKELRGKVET